MPKPHKKSEKVKKEAKGKKVRKHSKIAKPTASIPEIVAHVPEIASLYSSEIVFALCGPIGSPSRQVAERLEHILITDYGYECKTIRLSDIINDNKLRVLKKTQSGHGNDGYERLNQLIAAGNLLRKDFGNKFLAEGAIHKIYQDRKNTSEDGAEIVHIAGPGTGEPKSKGSGSAGKKTGRVAYILDSIKTKDELNLLRSVYRDLMYFIGVFAPLHDRIESLKTQIGDEKGLKVGQFIDEDSGKEKGHGQNVKDTFPLADFFVRVENHNYAQIDIKLKRFLNLIFEKEIITPTPQESAMYFAASAAQNSACLSRQVGAALTDEKGEIISLGWNDVPKFEGDLYRSDLVTYGAVQTDDHRCMFVRGGICHNDREKDYIVDLIYSKLLEQKLLIADNYYTSKEYKEILEKEFKDKHLEVKILANVKEAVKEVLRDSKIKSLLEFSRSIHAEMHAIIMGSQSQGNRVKKGKLFITTYPCHMCARHIIVAGIKEVYYIEPYTKSLTTKLHFDSITEDEKDMNKVRIIMFEGIGPNRFLELFKMKSPRKIDGRMVQYDGKTQKPKTTSINETTLKLEEIISKTYTNKIESH